MFNFLKKVLSNSYVSNQVKPFFSSIKNLSSSKKIDRDYFLKQVGLEERDIYWPKPAENDVKVDYWKQNPSNIKEMYSGSDLSKLPVFQGGYINFGFWSDLNELNFDTEHRIKASELLYQQIAETAQLNKESIVVDVGCGIGFGAQYIMKQYQPKMLVGLDFAPQQISRAKSYHKDTRALFSHERFKFIVGDATQMPFSDNSLSHVISVEAVQHFSSLEKFIGESRRVLKPEGRLIFTTFFATGAEGREALKALVPDYRTHCSDILAEEVVSSLQKDLKQIQVESIGDRVWPGLEKWMKKIGYQNQWTMLWPALYRAKYIDYFIFQAEAPASRASNELEYMPHAKALIK